VERFLKALIRNRDFPCGPLRALSNIHVNNSFIFRVHEHAVKLFPPEAEFFAPGLQTFLQRSWPVAIKVRVVICAQVRGR
jgi:hypothetical protein